LSQAALLALPQVADAVGVFGPPVQLAWEEDWDTVPEDGVAAHAGKHRRAMPAVSAANATARGALLERMALMVDSPLLDE
jgi:hypothetical protein